mmetsp:Transcript_13816/g.17489  ORF Transcript_13816/g.17489 Transcript_13816/m.17489 type:complete len:88 (-) Transcript_13816:589-852(-)
MMHRLLIQQRAPLARMMTMQPRMLMQKPMFLLAPMAMRSVHSRGYNNYDDSVTMTFHEVNLMLMNARNTPNIVYVYQRFGPDVMTPE